MGGAGWEVDSSEMDSSVCPLVSNCEKPRRRQGHAVVLWAGLCYAFLFETEFTSFMVLQFEKVGVVLCFPAIVDCDLASDHKVHQAEERVCVFRDLAPNRKGGVYEVGPKLYEI